VRALEWIVGREPVDALRDNGEASGNAIPGDERRGRRVDTAVGILADMADEDDPNTEIREDLASRYPQEHGDLDPADPTTDVDGPAAAKHGDYYFDVQDYDQALARYLAAVEKGLPDDHERGRVLFNIAVCYHHKGDLASGLPYIRQAVDVPAYSDDVTFLKSYFFFREGHSPGQG